MRLNQFTIIEGHSVYLIPYKTHHVKKYHEWMTSSELQLLTASEPLSLEEEFDMQKKWRDDPDIKYFHIILIPSPQCTFIILWKSKYQEKNDELDSMIGDANIFLKDEDGTAEVEIMIAEKSARGKGFGKEAVLLMIKYGVMNLNIKTYKAIILKDNLRSISLFERIGFQKVDENKVFNEFIFEKKVCDEWISWLDDNITKYLQKENNY